METLSRFDLVELDGVVLVVVESDLLLPDLAVVTVPLLPDYPAVTRLNPEFVVNGRRLVMATRLIGPLPRTALRKVGGIAQHGDEILRAIDVLISGV